MQAYESHSYIQLPHGAKIRKENVVFKRDMIFMDSIGQEIISTVKGTKAEIEFLKHSWSGVVEIKCGDFITVIDLFSETHLKYIFTIELPSNASSLAIKVVDASSFRDNNNNSASEVWIGKINFNNEFSPAEISVIPINKWLSFLNGEYGSYMVLNTDVGASRTILHEGAWAKHDVKLFSQYVKPGMTVYEVGSHIGHHSVVFSKLCGNEGRVYAFEPQNFLFKLLNTNLLINNCNNATAIRLALGNKKSKAKLWPVDYTKDDNFGALSISQSDNKILLDHLGEDVDIITGDSFVSELVEARQKVDFIKIDAQSFELYILQGFINTLKEKKPILFLEIEPFFMQSMGYHYSEIFNLLYSLNYSIYLPYESLDTPIKDIPNWDTNNKSIGCDILALPS
ncbi:MAG: FkbM family methyltransferase [Bacteroidetes bacterium]|nr:FkbM family methyltransferase [Bacteroidota bacterium]